MTSTLTRPSAPLSGDAGRAAAPASGGWFTSGDHKRLGMLFIAGGLVALVVTGVSAAVFHLPSVADSPFVWTAPGSRLASANAAGALLIGIPALWIGLATYVVPLQIGATRLALPRLHALALWTYAAGGVLVVLGHVIDRPAINSFASSLPPVATAGARASEATQLAISGIALVAIATLLAAVSLLVTILNRRAEGVRLTFMPLFCWSTLAAGSVLVLAVPVFLGGLVLLYYDQHYGGTVFAGGPGGRRIWQHELWLLGQPLALVFAGSAVGIVGDIVATHARRPLVAFPVARAAAAAAPLSALVLWAGNLSVLASPFAPVATVPALLVGAPLGLSLLTWLATLKAGKPRMHASLFFAVAFLAVAGLATALSLAAVMVGVEGRDAEAFRNGQITLLVLGAPLLGVTAGLVHWSPKLWSRGTTAGTGGLQALLVLGGVVLLASPGALIGLGAGDGVTVIGTVGAIALVAGVLPFASNVAGSFARTARRGEDDPYGGLTLEWATTSPPPAHNFDVVPDVRSPYPLAPVGDDA